MRAISLVTMCRISLFVLAPLVLAGPPVSIVIKILLLVTATAASECVFNQDHGHKHTVIPWLVTAGLAACVMLAMLKYLDRPVIPIGAYLVVFFGRMAASGGGRMRVVAAQLVAVIGAFMIAELWVGGFEALGLSRKDTMVAREFATGRVRHLVGLVEADPELGFRGIKDASVRVTRRSSNGLIFAATYSFDPQGWRGGQRRIGGRGTEAIVLLGDSFAFGEGVDDHETLGAQLEVMSTGRYEVENAAMIGYGPHQSLAILEKRERPAAGRRTSGVFYAAFDPARPAGRAFWDTAGPCYEAEPSGAVRYSGSLASQRKVRFFSLLNKSLVMRTIIHDRLNTDSDLARYVAILKRLRQRFLELYQGDFWFVLWGRQDDADFQFVLSELKRAGAEVLEYSSAMAEAGLDPRDSLITGDGHPNARGHQAVASALLRRISQGKDAGSADREAVLSGARQGRVPE